MLKTRFLITILTLLSFAIGSVAHAQDDPVSAADLADDNGAFATIDGARIYYVSAGQPDQPPVILVHGLNGSTANWLNTVPALAEAGYYTIALDLPPFGLSDKNIDLDYTHRQMADWVVGLMDELGIEQATIVGHSMGGLVTTYIAAHHPQRVERVGLVSGGVFEALDDRFDDASENFRNLLAVFEPDAPLLNLLLSRLINRQFVEQSLQGAVYNPDVITEDMIEANTRPLRIEGALAGFVAFAQTAPSTPPTLEEFANAVGEKPVFIAWGLQDRVVPLALGEAQRDALNNVTYTTYDQVGHLPMDEVPTQFNADLIAFLEATN